MNKLCYLPKPAEFESPKSLLMRMAHYNGFGTVRNMCSYFALIPPRWSDLLGQSSPLLDIVEQQAPVLTGDLRRIFYSILPHPRSFKVDNIFLPRGACANSLRYCPQCIDAAQSPIFHDLADLEVCLLHGLKLISTCPHCHMKQFWHNAQLLNCQCGFQRSAANRIIGDFMPAVTDPFKSHHVVEDISLKYNIAKLCATLWEARRRADHHQCCNLPIQVIDHIDRTVALQTASYPGFIRPLHMAPWINGGSAAVAWLASRALNRLSTHKLSCHAHVCCRLATIDYQIMLRAVFGDERATAETLHTYNLDRWIEQPPPDDSTGLPRCQIIRRANAAYRPAYTPPSENLEGMTQDEVATTLKCSLSTVNRLRNQGWFVGQIKPVPYRSFLPDVLNKNATTQFAKQYILLDELCTRLGLTSDLCEHLTTAAEIRLINPFCEPKFYHRTTVCVMLKHLRRHLRRYRLVCDTDPQRSSDSMTPVTLRNIQYTLNLTDRLRSDPPPYTSDQKREYVRSVTKPSTLDNNTPSANLFDINDVFTILKIPPTEGLTALREFGIDPRKLPHVCSGYSLLDIEIIRDILRCSTHT
jgi:hypothetical protein